MRNSRDLGKIFPHMKGIPVRSSSHTNRSPVHTKTIKHFCYLFPKQFGLILLHNVFHPWLADDYSKVLNLNETSRASFILMPNLESDEISLQFRSRGFDEILYSSGTSSHKRSNKCLTCFERVILSFVEYRKITSFDSLRQVLIVWQKND